MIEEHTQYLEKVYVWRGIVEDDIIGSFFIDGNLNGDNYLRLFQNNVVPPLTNLYPDLAEMI